MMSTGLVRGSQRQADANHQNRLAVGFLRSTSP
jgi:hypothetical protein